MAWKHLPRVAIVGVGNVGAACANTLLQQDLSDELILVGRRFSRTQGEAMDLRHVNPGPRAREVRAGQIADCRNADIVIICANSGPSFSASGKWTRDQLLSANARLADELFPQALSPNAIVIMVSNPVDTMTLLALKSLGLQHRARVIGLGTLVDTLRFRELIATRHRASPKDVEAWVIGEHGDTMVPVWSWTKVRGASVPSDEVTTTHLKRMGVAISELKGSTAWTTAHAVGEIVRAVVEDRGQVLTVSSFLPEEGVAASLPCAVGRAGIQEVFRPALSESEHHSWKQSIEKISATLTSLEVPSPIGRALNE